MAIASSPCIRKNAAYVATMLVPVLPKCSCSTFLLVAPRRRLHIDSPCNQSNEGMGVRGKRRDRIQVIRRKRKKGKGKAKQSKNTYPSVTRVPCARVCQWMPTLRDDDRVAVVYKTNLSNTMSVLTKEHKRSNPDPRRQDWSIEGNFSIRHMTEPPTPIQQNDDHAAESCAEAF